MHIPATAPEDLFDSSFNNGLRKKAVEGHYASFTCNTALFFSFPEIQILAKKVLQDILADESLKQRVRQKFALGA